MYTLHVPSIPGVAASTILIDGLPIVANAVGGVMRLFACTGVISARTPAVMTPSCDCVPDGHTCVPNARCALSSMSSHAHSARTMADITEGKNFDHPPSLPTRGLPLGS